MNKSASIAKLAEALRQFQSEVPAVPFNAVNPFLKNKYADLGSVIETIRPGLAKHGLSYTQFVGGEAGVVSVSTMLMHTSGEWIENTISMEVGKQNGLSQAQALGVDVTYLRRYSLSATFGLYADEDNDGNGNGTAQRKPAGKPASKPEQGKSEKAPAKPAAQPEKAPAIKVWTQKDFVKWAKDNHNLETKDVGPALVKGGFKGFDPKQIDAMKDAIQKYAVESGINEREPA